MKDIFEVRGRQHLEHYALFLCLHVVKNPASADHYVESENEMHVIVALCMSLSAIMSSLPWLDITDIMNGMRYRKNIHPAMVVISFLVACIDHLKVCMNRLVLKLLILNRLILMFALCLRLYLLLFAWQHLLGYGVEEQFEVKLSFLIVISSACYHGVALQRWLGVDYIVGWLAQ